MVAQYYRYHTYFPYRRRVNQGRLAVLGIKSAAKPFWIYLKTRQDVLANGRLALATVAFWFDANLCVLLGLTYCGSLFSDYSRFCWDNAARQGMLTMLFGWERS
jgi:hypothetical protein